MTHQPFRDDLVGKEKASLTRIWLKVALVVATAGGLYFSGATEPFLAYFDARQMIAVLIVQPVILLGLVLQGVRHVVLIGSPGLSVLTATKAVVLSQGLNILLPARLSEVLKATYMRDRANVPMSAAVSAVLLERTVDLIIVVILGFTCVFFFAAMVNKLVVLAFFVTAAIIVSVGLWGRRSIVAMARRLPWPRLANLVERMYLHFSTNVQNKVFFRGLCLGLIIWAVAFLNIFLFLSVAGGTKIAVYGVLLVFVCTALGGAVPALPGGLGTYEAAAVFALMTLGYPFADALALAVTLHAAQLALPFLLALIVMLTERLGLLSLIRDLRTPTPPSHL